MLAATNRDPEAMVGRGTRADLYFRVNVLPIRMPPPQPGRDIVLLARDFAEQVAWLWPKGPMAGFSRAPWSSSTPDSLRSRMQQTWHVNGQLWGASRTSVRRVGGEQPGCENGTGARQGRE